MGLPGELLATAIGFQELGARTKSTSSTCWGYLMNAVGKWLDNNKSPAERSTRSITGSNFYVACTGRRSWPPRTLLAAAGTGVKDNEAPDHEGTVDCQGAPCGWRIIIKLDEAKAEVAMRPLRSSMNSSDKY